MNEVEKVFEGTDKALFILLPGKILVQTGVQEFYLMPQEWENEDDLDMIAYFIERGKINDLRSLRRRIRGRFYLQHTYKRHGYTTPIMKI